MQFYDGMHGVIVEKGKDYLYIATRKEKLIDHIIMGYYPKPNFEQIGQFHGNVEGFEYGDTVEIYFKHEQNSLKKSLKIFLLTYVNIASVRKVKSGKKLSRIEKIIEFFSLKT